MIAKPSCLILLLFMRFSVFHVSMRGIIPLILLSVRPTVFKLRNTCVVSRLFGGKETVFLSLLFILPFVSFIAFLPCIFILGTGTKPSLLLLWQKSSPHWEPYSYLFVVSRLSSNHFLQSIWGMGCISICFPHDSYCPFSFPPSYSSTRASDSWPIHS